MDKSRVLPAAVALCLASGLARAAVAAPQSGVPVVPGLADSKLPPRVRGLVLLAELGCVACHRHDGASEIEARDGPDLTTAPARVRGDHLQRFLIDPLGVQPGTVMPDLLHDEADPPAAARALLHYLRSRAPSARPATEASTPDPAAAARGRALFHSIGCAACHPPRDARGAEIAVEGSVSLGHVGAKYERPALQDFLLAPHLAHPARRMPDLHLAPSEAFELSCFLLASAPTGDGRDDAGGELDAAAVATGRALFSARGCAHCHQVPDRLRPESPQAAPLRALDSTRGCLSGHAGAWPLYALAGRQRADLAAALETLDAPLDAEARIQLRLAARNCTACHERGGHGGVRADRDALFTSADPGVGEDGRLPPTLTGVGAKLQPEWLAGAIADGQHERPYMRTRMPGFGRECGDALAKLMAETDELPAIEMRPLPAEKDAARADLDLGRELVGDEGMNCIACHHFAGDRAGAIGALDLVHSTGRRLRPQWFAHFLRAPARFKPNTLMPQFFPDGVSTRPKLGGGDAARQIDAMWHYLAEGRNVRKPHGLRPPPIELRVGDDAVILRRAVQHAGKRGISVGYPHGVNLTFDAERLGLDQIWWGDFLDAAPVWTGQGSGEARILSRDRVELPPGPAIVALPDADAPWPAATRRELGQRWLGYDLDARQRPSFRYVAAGVEVTDTPVELAEGDALTRRPRLRRTLQFYGAGDEALWLRASRDERVEDVGGGVVQVGANLRLRLGGAPFRIRAVEGARELLVEIHLRARRAEVVVEYEWCGEVR